MARINPILRHKVCVVAQQALHGCIRQRVSLGCGRPPVAPLLHTLFRVYLLLGKLNIAPSRTPADGQRWVMVLRLV
jgi:hypothetical protein